MPFQKLSIIIPVYNEEKTVAEIVRRILKVEYPGVEKEIIIVDDGSTDNTAEILHNLSVPPPFQGGAACPSELKRSGSDGLPSFRVLPLS
jgi:GT2 family glycosyltransferase